VLVVSATRVVLVGSGTSVVEVLVNASMTVVVVVSDGGDVSAKLVPAARATAPTRASAVAGTRRGRTRSRSEITHQISAPVGAR